MHFVYSEKLNAMSEAGYKIRNQAAIHFITFAVVEWVDIFTRKQYRDIVLESIKYCQAEKGLLLHAWCIMSNHLHLIASAKNSDLSDILRDFKKFTSKEIIRAIPNNKQESRKVFRSAVTTNDYSNISKAETVLFFVIKKIKDIVVNVIEVCQMNKAVFLNFKFNSFLL